VYPFDGIKVAKGSHIFRYLFRIQKLKVSVDNRDKVAIFGLQGCFDFTMEFFMDL